MSTRITRLSRHRQSDHLHGGAIIDAHGREIPITEHMIELAIQALIREQQPPRCQPPCLQLVAGRDSN